MKNSQCTRNLKWLLFSSFQIIIPADCWTGWANVLRDCLSTARCTLWQTPCEVETDTGPRSSFTTVAKLCAHWIATIKGSVIVQNCMLYVFIYWIRAGGFGYFCWFLECNDYLWTSRLLSRCFCIVKMVNIANTLHGALFVFNSDLVKTCNIIYTLMMQSLKRRKWSCAVEHYNTFPAQNVLPVISSHQMIPRFLCASSLHCLKEAQSVFACNSISNLGSPYQLMALFLQGGEHTGQFGKESPSSVGERRSSQSGQHCIQQGCIARLACTTAPSIQGNKQSWHLYISFKNQPGKNVSVGLIHKQNWLQHTTHAVSKIRKSAKSQEWALQVEFPAKTRDGMIDDRTLCGPHCKFVGKKTMFQTVCFLHLFFWTQINLIWRERKRRGWCSSSVNEWPSQVTGTKISWREIWDQSALIGNKLMGYKWDS